MENHFLFVYRSKSRTTVILNYFQIYISYLKVDRVTIVLTIQRYALCTPLNHLTSEDTFFFCYKTLSVHKTMYFSHLLCLLTVWYEHFSTNVQYFIDQSKMKSKNFNPGFPRHVGNFSFKQHLSGVENKLHRSKSVQMVQAPPLPFRKRKQT